MREKASQLCRHSSGCKADGWEDLAGQGPGGQSTAKVTGLMEGRLEWTRYWARARIFDQASDTPLDQTFRMHIEHLPIQQVQESAA